MKHEQESGEHSPRLKLEDEGFTHHRFRERKSLRASTTIQFQSKTGASGHDLLS